MAKNSFVAEVTFKGLEQVQLPEIYTIYAPSTSFKLLNILEETKKNINFAHIKTKQNINFLSMNIY